MIPLEGLAFEYEHYNQGKDCQRYHLLDNLELHQVEWASIPLETHPVGSAARHIRAIASLQARIPAALNPMQPVVHRRVFRA